MMNSTKYPDIEPGDKVRVVKVIEPRNSYYGLRPLSECVGMVGRVCYWKSYEIGGEVFCVVDLYGDDILIGAFHEEELEVI